MPYYRYTLLENDLEVQELYLFGFFAFTGRFGMTYEFPLAKHIDYSDVDAFEAATSGGCPPGAGAGSLPPIGPQPGGGGGIPLDDLECDGDVTGVGDTILRFFLRPQVLEFPFSARHLKHVSVNWQSRTLCKSKFALLLLSYDCPCESRTAGDCEKFVNTVKETVDKHPT